MASQRAITTFCWLPPDSVVMRSSLVAQLDLQPLDVAGQPRARARGRDQRRRDVSRPSVGMPKFSRIDLDSNSDSARRSRGT